MAIPDAYSGRIAQMQKDNPSVFTSPDEAFAWGKKNYGWDDAGTGGTGSTGASTTTTTTSQWGAPLNYTIDAAPGYTGVQRQAPTVAQPTLGAQPTFSGPGQFSYNAFQAPTGQQALEQDPGYQFRLDQGRKAMDASAAARGTVLGGNQLQALTQYGQDMASQEYANAYQRARDAYQTNRDTAYGTWDRNYGAATDAYSRDVYDRDARYQAGSDTWQRDMAERNAAYDAGNTQAQLGYKPSYDTWQAQQLARANMAGMNFDRDYQQRLYDRDDRFRWDSLGRDDAYRWGALNTDDRYRRDAMDLQNRQFLAELGYRG